jgi:hypothetical protein
MEEGMASMPSPCPEINPNTNDTAAAAAKLRAAGFALTKPDPGKKSPTYCGWSTKSKEPKNFAEGDPIGIQGGALSDGNRPGHSLIPVDLDADDALTKADDFLPPTGMMDEREGKPKAHRYFLVPNKSIPKWAQSTASQASRAARILKGHRGPFVKHFKHAQTKKGILDFLGTGSQVVCPSPGNNRRWVGGERGEPAVVDFTVLWYAVCDLGVACGCVDPREPKPGPKPKPDRKRKGLKVTVPPESNGASTDSDVAEVDGVAPELLRRVLAYLATVEPAVEGQNGHDGTYWPARVVCWGFDLGKDRGFRVLREHYNPRCQPPWTDAELAHKCENADTQPFGKPRGWLLEDRCITNAAHSGDSLNPYTMAQIKELAAGATGDWPRRVGAGLFVHDGAEVSWLGGAAALFGYYGSVAGVVRWNKGIGCHTKEEVFAEMQRTATAYKALEVLPHEPPIAGHYYACAEPPVGDGKALAGLLARFRPSTVIDGDLIKAMFATALWGGAGGARPAFVITSKAGRGAGKSKLATMLGHLTGGLIDLAADEDIEVIKQRLLSPDGFTKRVALLDNVKSWRFSRAEFESIITSPTISGKKLYVGEATRPNTLTWVLTLNGVSLGADMAQRGVIIEIDKPERSGAWEEDTYAYIDAHRERIVGDLLGFLRGPRVGLRQYSRWAGWERDVLSRLPEPEDAQKVILERQGSADVEQEEHDIIEEFFRGRLERLGYNPEAQRVRIPVAIAARWYVWATGDNLRVSAVSRLLNAAIDEGKMRRIRRDAGRAFGRCFLWAGQYAASEDTTCNDIEDRIREHGGDPKPS